MFDIWLRAFWRTFLWWLPGADDDGETAYGKQPAERSEAARGTAASGGSGGATGRTTGTGAPASAAPSATSQQARAATAPAGPASPATPAPAKPAKAKPAAAGAGNGHAGETAAGANGGEETATDREAPAKGGESTPAAGGESEDLTVIKGIGPTLASRLHGLGITSMHDLARADPDQVAEKLASRPVTPERVRQWVDEAKSRVG